MRILGLLLILGSVTFAHTDQAEKMRCFKNFDKKIKELESYKVSSNGTKRPSLRPNPTQLRLLPAKKRT